MSGLAGATGRRPAGYRTMNVKTGTGDPHDSRHMLAALGLARRGLAVRPRPATPGDFHADARRAGYHADPEHDSALLAAFRDRFRPGAEGPLDDTDRALMADLAARWPAA